MPVVKVTDLAYGRLRSPDLDKQEEFLTAFGMVRGFERYQERALYIAPAPTSRTISMSRNSASHEIYRHAGVPPRAARKTSTS